ncbi:MAG: hypothetical protein COB22_08795 [Cycloclasticus sp.]|nr:MAG: hypothetical protein COB22_08795 [Cycloclasticus sp.]
MTTFKRKQALLTAEIVHDTKLKYAEKYTKNLNDSSELQKQIIDNAKQGLSKAIFIPDKPINIEGTPAANALITKLENEGYKTEWQEMTFEAREKKNPLGEDIIYKALVVRWA